MNTTPNTVFRFREPAHRRLLIVALIVIGLAGLQAAPDGWHAWLAWRRTDIASGQFWRLLSSNLVHLSWAHLWLNAAGGALILWIFGSDRSAWAWFAGFLWCSLASGVGLYFVRPELQSVVGLSGALHGLFVIGVIGWIRAGDWMGWALLAGVAAKLVWEQYAGAVPMSSRIIGGPVVTDAHLWGAMGGLLFGIVETWRSRRASL